MAMPINAALSAYGNAQSLFGGAGKATPIAPAATQQGGDFASFLADSVQSVVDAGKASDQKSLDLVNGKANVVDVVTAISETEIAMETMVTVRDRVITAYEEIMRMPI
jgi:flagellar hook-basal body complex protein FliE